MTSDDRPLILLGVDIGKSAHYAVAVDRDGQTVYSKPVVNEESALRLLVLWARAHQAAVIVDQPGGTAALLLKLCLDATTDIGDVSGLVLVGFPHIDDDDIGFLHHLLRFGYVDPMKWLAFVFTGHARLQLLRKLVDLS